MDSEDDEFPDDDTIVAMIRLIQMRMTRRLNGPGVMQHFAPPTPAQIGELIQFCHLFLPDLRLGLYRSAEEWFNLLCDIMSRQAEFNDRYMDAVDNNDQFNITVFDHFVVQLDALCDAMRAAVMLSLGARAMGARLNAEQIQKLAEFRAHNPVFLRDNLLYFQHVENFVANFNPPRYFTGNSQQDLEELCVDRQVSDPTDQAAVDAHGEYVQLKQENLASCFRDLGIIEASRNQ